MYKFTYFLLVLFFVSCASSKNVQTIQGNLTEVQLDEIDSYVHIPIKINISSYLKEADKSVPMNLVGGEDPCEGMAYQYTFDRNPIQLSGLQNKFTLGITGKYGLKVSYCPKCSGVLSDNSCITPRFNGSCGINEEKRKIEIDYLSELKISNSYKLSSSTKISDIRTIDRCEFTFLKYDVTQKVIDQVKKPLMDIATEIDKSIAKIDLKSSLEALWGQLNTPIPVESYGSIYFHASELALSKMDLQKNSLNFFLSIQAKPELHLVPLPAYRASKLPALSAYIPKEGFQLHVQAFAPYDSLSNLLNKELKGKKIDLKGNELIIENTRISGSDAGKLAIEVRFSGSKKGTFIVEGTPTLDSNKKRISMPDLNFDIKSKNALLKTAKWLFSAKITSVIKEAAQFDYAQILLEVRKELEKNLNRDLEENIQLKGKVKEADLLLILPESNRLRLQMLVNGQLSVTIP